MKNKDKTYKIYISNTEFEVSEEEYKEHHKIMEHSKYLRKEERKVKILSYESLDDGLSAEDIIPDTSVDVEETAINNVMIGELRKILTTLSKDELELIEHLVYEEKSAPSQQKWTQKSFKKRNESQYFVNLLKPTAFIPRFA